MESSSSIVVHCHTSCVFVRTSCAHCCVVHIPILIHCWQLIVNCATTHTHIFPGSNEAQTMSVLLFLVWSKIVTSSQEGQCCFAQACSVMADFFVSPRLMAAWCSFRRIFRVLLVSLCTPARSYMYMESCRLPPLDAWMMKKPTN